jgi:NAD(P)-dependent dehydrogenase (short-subunit alcohol dehydrogenase family)
LGAASAIAFARAGASIAISDLPGQATKAKEVIETLKKEVPGVKAIWLPHDVRDEGQWQSVVAELVSSPFLVLFGDGRLDCVVLGHKSNWVLWTF